MEGYQRYAVYYAPEPGPLATFGASWLGWDAARGRRLDPPDLPGLPLPTTGITESPRRYGFHATIKPPFHLTPGRGAEALDDALADLCGWLKPVSLEGLELTRLGHFLALGPRGPVTELASLATHVVMALDDFRAAPSGDEISRRRPEGLTETQRALLRRWGYPYVMEEFRFHMTLTGRLTGTALDATEAVLAGELAPLLPRPFPVTSLCLFGERRDGWFRLLRRHRLGD